MSLSFVPNPINSIGPNSAQAKAQQKQQEKLDQVFSQYQALVGQPVDVFTYSAASEILGQLDSPQQLDRKGQVSLDAQKQMIMNSLQQGSLTGQLDSATLLAGMLRLNQIQETQGQATTQVTSFLKSSLQPLEPPPKKHSSDEGGEG